VSEPLSQADVERAWPQWKTWTGTDQLCHARRAGGAALTESGEDWPDSATRSGVLKPCWRPAVLPGGERIAHQRFVSPRKT